jgi:small GTP-binding protein
VHHSLLFLIHHQVFVPTVFETYNAEFNIDGVQVQASLWDTGGQDDYDRIRPLSYPDAHIFCICFGIENPASLENVLEKVSRHLAF